MKRKNAFTLIELLAVIVILAIIALIATPIILGIVEDARKDSFMRSVELVINATDIDIFGKNYTDTYAYTIEDGSISDLEVGVKNTEGMNGSIVYDSKGLEQYAIHNGKYCVIKTASMNKAEIKDYVEGECKIILENIDKRVLATITSKVPNENDVVTYTNGQLINLGDYGIRYQGADPDNYIYFNCEDYSKQTNETCEIWRIIGVVDGKVKIIKNESIGQMSWNDQDGDDIYDSDTDNNDWNNSTLKNYLNGEYLTSLTAKNSATGDMISPSTWYLRGTSSNITKDEVYNAERTTGAVSYETPYIENTKIGLMYPSDYGYAAMETESCLAYKQLYYYEPCKQSSWINQGTTNYQWLITPSSMATSGVFTAFSDDYGKTDGYGVANFFKLEEMGVMNFYDVFPVLYLTSDIEIEGDGTQNTPFQLRLK